MSTKYYQRKQCDCEPRKKSIQLYNWHGKDPYRNKDCYETCNERMNIYHSKKCDRILVKIHTPAIPTENASGAVAAKSKEEKKVVPDEAQDETTDNEESSCVICLENKKCCLIDPCGHAVLCVSCARGYEEQIKSNAFNCPVCRIKVEKIIRIYG
jgi:hypothetical protein